MSWNFFWNIEICCNILENLEILWKQHLLRWTISSHVDSGICQKGFSQQWKEDVWRMQNVQNGKQYSADASSSQKSRENARIHSRILLLCLFKRFGLISMLPTSIQLYFLIKISRFLSLVIIGSFFICEIWQYFWCFASQSPNAAISFWGVLPGRFSCSFKTIYFILSLLRIFWNTVPVTLLYKNFLGPQIYICSSEWLFVQELWNICTTTDHNHTFKWKVSIYL